MAGFDVAVIGVGIGKRHSKETFVNLTNPEWDINEEEVIHVD